LNDAYNAGGGIVYFPAGTYTLNNTSLPIYSNVTWLGDGMGVTTIAANATSHASGIVVQPLNNNVAKLRNISFVGITFDAGGAPSGDFSIISVKSSGHENITFRDCEFTNQNGTPSTVIYLGGQPQFGDGYAHTTTGSYTVPAVGSSATLSLTFDSTDRIGIIQLALDQIVVGPQQYQGLLTDISTEDEISYTLTIETTSLGAATAGGEFAADLRWATVLQSANCGFYNCTITENTTGTGDLAALSMYSHAFATVQDCTFSSNDAATASAALMFYGFNSDCCVRRNVFSDNLKTDLQVNCVRAIVKDNLFYRTPASTFRICIKISNNSESIFSGNVFDSNGSNVYAIAIEDLELIDSTPTWIAATTQCLIEGNVFNEPYCGIYALPYTTGSELNQAYRQIRIRENRCASPGSAFVYLDNSTSGAPVSGISDIVISDNHVLPIASGAHGVYVATFESDSVTGLRITNNIFGSGASPGGIGTYCDVIQGFSFVGNNCLSCTTALSLAGGALARNAQSNPGYNPQGYVSGTVPTSGASYSNPFPFPVNVYISGGTVSAIALNGQTVASGSGVVVQLGTTSDELTITYSAAPTVAWFGL
jgi:hypothetical protein